MELKYWDMIVEEDMKETTKSLKMLPKLTMKKIHPVKTDRMKVVWPFQVSVFR